MNDQDACKSFYQQLESPDLFRFVELLPGTGGEPVRTSLHICPLEKPPYFDVLSCPRDKSDNDEHRIVCDDHELPVSRDLHYTLQYLRSEIHSRWLWIDAISIYEEDQSETSCCVRTKERVCEAAFRTMHCIVYEDILLLEDFTHRTHRLDQHQRTKSYLYTVKDILHSPLRVTCKDLQHFREAIDWGQPDSVGNEIQDLLEQPWSSWVFKTPKPRFYRISTADLFKSKTACDEDAELLPWEGFAAALMTWLLFDQNGTISSGSLLSISTEKVKLLLDHPESNFSITRSNQHEREPFESWYVFDQLTDERTCRGFTIDIIRRRSESAMPPRRYCDHYIVGDNAYFFTEWFEFAMQHGAKKKADEVLLEFTDTIQARGCGHIWEDPDLTAENRIEQTKEFLRFLEDPDSVLSNSTRIFYAACFASHERRFAVTREGRFCLVPAAAKDGDLVCVPHGSRVPFIFRPMRGNKTLSNIGEAYVYGIMQGEGYTIDPQDEQEFVLVSRDSLW